MLCKVLNINSGNHYSTDDNDFLYNGNGYSAWGGDAYRGRIVRGAKKLCKVIDVTSGDDYSGNDFSSVGSSSHHKLG